MRNIKHIIFLSTVVLLMNACPPNVHSQYSVEYQKTFRVRSLSGIVLCGPDKGSPVKDVLVEETSPDWKTVVSSTRTDESGHFIIPTSNGKSLHYLRFSAYGFLITKVRARVSIWANRKELHLKIAVAN
jgi:hypothetical protein